MTLKRIVSGGQTGVDRGALDAALEAGFPCGGWCPAGRRAEDGRIPDRYPLTETVKRDYLDRTRRNVIDSDGTLILFFGAPEGGTAWTRVYCNELSRPYLLIDGDATPARAAAESALGFIGERGIAVLNVAGPRRSKVPRAAEYAFQVVTILLRGALTTAAEARR